MRPEPPVRILFLGLLLLLAAPALAAESAPTFPKDLPFDPKEWKTAEGYPPIGDPRAKRDVKDSFVVRWESFLPTLRGEGPNSNLVEISRIHLLVNQPLVQLHPDTEEFIPCLASHWKIETDEAKGTQTFWFRINPKARWADGSEVTADDVQKTFWHRVQEDRKDPSSVMTFREGFHDPEVLDKYTIRVKTKALNWRLFMYFGGSGNLIYPAKEIHIPGEQYLADYNWKLMTGSGPYRLDPADLKKGDSLTLTRRTDWWAEDEPWAKNTYNFAKIKFTVVREEELNYEMFKKGERDYYVATKAQRWVDEIPKEEIVKKGWVKRRKIYNQAPQGFSGLAFNMREPPFNDKRVRLAFCHLFNRERLMEKLFYNEYEYLNSYFPGSDWGAGKENPQVTYDPVRAAELLEEAGYKERDDEGFLIGPDGKRFELTFEFGTPTFERIWLVVKEDFENAGIKFDLKLIDATTLIKKISERRFKLHHQSWTGLLFPNPETSWRSSLADQQANNNITGFKNARVDELAKKYNVTFDRAEQKKIIREIDKIVYEEHPFALGWYANYDRILYWDKFGHPKTYFTRIGDDPVHEMILTWWFDADRARALEAARKEGKSLEPGEMIVKPWG